MLENGFETTSVRMESMLLVSIQAPPEDVERVMDQVARITPLKMGNYDNNAYQSASGIERYRPLDGAAAGREDAIRKRPGVVTVSFQLPRDPSLLAELIEAVFQVHSYQEPCITVQDVLVSRSKGLDDSRNPNRWWNSTGDWKQQGDGQGPETA